jgi:flagellar hook-length control protein FliK
MALEGLPVSTLSVVPAPTGVPPFAPAAAGPLTTEFLQILAGTMVGASPASSGESLPVDSPGASISDDDTLEDEIGFEDLSEFLTQVIVPGATPLPPPAPSDENTLEMDFSQSGYGGSTAGRPVDLTSLIHSLTADQDTKGSPLQQRDPVIGADTTLLRDALAAESMAAAALQDTGTDSLSFADSESAPQQVSFGQLHAPVHSTHTSAPPLELKSPMGTQQWADELGTKLTWMAHQGRESASLTLSPEHLGPIEVKISMQDGQASVWFGAQHADTRSAIEQALPRLRELFSAQGMSLADSGVFREAPRQQPQPFSGGSRGAANGEEVAGVSSVTKRGNGILDLYA